MKKQQLKVTGLFSFVTMISLAQNTTFNSMTGAPFYQTNVPAVIEWPTSNWGSGFSHKIYNWDAGNGNVLLNFAGRHNSATWVDLMTIKSDGNIGIGTTNPTTKLEIADGSTQPGAMAYLPLLKLRSNNWQCFQEAGIEFWNGNGNSSFRTGATARIVSKMENCSNDGESLRFETLSKNQSVTTPKLTIEASGKTNISVDDFVGPTNNYVPLLVLKSNKWLGNQEAGIEFWNGNGNNSVRTGATAKIISRMENGGNDGEALVFETQTAGQSFTSRKMMLTNDGKLFIGSANQNGAIISQYSGNHANALLHVNGKIVSTEVVVTQQNWADFVFDDNYKLMPLSKVESFYKQNHHLPEVPTTKEIIEKGNDLGKTDALLLQKIEELTLYIVEQQKQIDELKKAAKH